MSIQGMLNHGEFVTFDCEPAWSKAERYAYCEPFDQAKDGMFGRLLSSLRAVFTK